jgi:hypothetical protein
MNEWLLFKLVDYVPQEADLNVTFLKGTTYEVIGVMEGRYSSTPPNAQDVGEKFGVGTYLIVKPVPSYSGRDLHVLQVEQETPSYTEPDGFDEATIPLTLEAAWNEVGAADAVAA